MESGLPVTGCRPPLLSLFKAYAARFAETLGAQSAGEDTNLHRQGFSIPDLHGPAGYLFLNDLGDHLKVKYSASRNVIFDGVK